MTGLRKAYGEQLVLDGVDLEVAQGTIFALLGPNGAGKTTIVQILSTLARADAGVLRVAGHDVAREPDAVRAAIGVTGQFSTVDNLLTGEENLILIADLQHLGRSEGRRRAAELLQRFDLVAAAMLPFLGSGFVPTDSMPAGVRWFAEHQPFTPIMETLRGLLLGAPIGDSAVLAVAWCAAIGLGGYVWAKRLFDRDPAH